MTDFSKVDVKDFLETLGVKVTSVSGRNALFLCPWHADRHASARMDLHSTMWLCDVCGFSGNAISFLARLRDMTNRDARYHIDLRYSAGTSSAIADLEAEVRKNIEGIAIEEEIRVLPGGEDWSRGFQYTWQHPGGAEAFEYMLGRGFTEELMKQWEIGYDIISGRVAIPVKDTFGKIVGFKGRSPNPDVHPKYLILGDPFGSKYIRYGFHTYRKSEFVYGLHRVSHGADIVIVEGELNVIAMWQKCHRPAGAVAGSEFSETQRRLIVERCNSAITYFDDDGWRCSRERHYRGEHPGPCEICGASTVNAGHKGTMKVIDALMPYMPVRVVRKPTGDANELEDVQIEQLLSTAQPALQFKMSDDLVPA